MSEPKRKTTSKNISKLAQYFPMIRTKEEILNDIKVNPALVSMFYGWTIDQQEEFLNFCTGVKGIKVLYDPFIKEILNPEYTPERLEEFLSLIMKQKVHIIKVLPNDSVKLADEVSLVITDIVVELEDHSIANIEIQKVGYLFPGQRCACYSADMLLRQYKRVRSEKKKFKYSDIKDVYTIVIYEKSPEQFKKFPEDYLHTFYYTSDTGLEMNLLQKFYFVPLDIFQKNLQNKGIKSKLDAWLTFLSTDEPEWIIKLIETYPQFKAMYQELYEICRNVEKVMDMFSRELREMDRNTAEYMVDVMQEKINQQKQELNQLNEQVLQKNEQLSQMNEQVLQKDEQLSQKDEQLSQKDEQLSQKDEQLSQKDEQLSQKDEQLSQKDEQLSQKDEQLSKMMLRTKMLTELHLLLLKDNRIADLQKAMEDIQMQDALLKEYQLYCD